jgi:hypothetical protein
MAGVRKTKAGKKVLSIASPKEFCTIKEFLEDIGINYDEYIEWSDGGCTFRISNLEEEKTSLLERDLILENLGYNLFYSETNEINVNEKLQYIKPRFEKEEKKKWQSIISKITAFERKCSSEGKKCPFESSILQIQIATKWTGNITTNPTEFKDFVTDLNNFLIERLENSIEERYNVHDFWQTMHAIRHGYSHDTTKWREKDKIKIAQKTRKFFQDAIGKAQPNTSVGFVTCQFKLLELCSDFLDIILGETNGGMG